MFYKINMLDGVMTNFLTKLNENCGPLKEQVQTINLFGMFFMIIGLICTTVLACVIGYMWNFGASAALLALYFVILLCVLRRNNQKT